MYAKSHTYLIGHNKPINEFQTAATHSSRRLRQLVTPIDDRALDTRSSFSPNSNNMAEPAQPLNINTLRNAYVVEELIQFTVGSNAEINANSHCIMLCAEA